MPTLCFFFPPLHPSFLQLTSPSILYLIIFLSLYFLKEPFTSFASVNFFLDFPGGSDSKASVYKAGDLGSIPRSGRFPGGGNGSPLDQHISSWPGTHKKLGTWLRQHHLITNFMLLKVHFFFI